MNDCLGKAQSTDTVLTSVGDCITPRTEIEQGDTTVALTVKRSCAGIEAAGAARPTLAVAVPNNI